MFFSAVCSGLLSKVFLAILILGSLLSLTGCWVYSVQPLYEENGAHPDPDLTFDQNLVGSWVQINTQCSWTLTVSGDRQSHVLNMAPGPECKSEDKPTRYEGHLLKLGSSEVIDVTPQSTDVCDLCLPLHSFLLVMLQNDSLTFVPMDHDWLVQQVKDGKVSLPELARHGSSDAVVLTSSSKQLKEFVSKYVSDKSAFNSEGDNELAFKRQQAQAR
jgi:hypothetical protein